MRAAFFSVATVDYFRQADRHVPGGNAFNQAIRFARLGWESVFVGAVGTDEDARLVRRALESSGADTSRLYSIEGATATNEIINDERGERYGAEGAWRGGVYSGFRLSDDDWDAIRASDVWSTHIDGPNLERAMAEQDGQFLTVDFLHLRDYRLLSSEQGRIDIAYFGGRQLQEDELLELSRTVDALLVLTLGGGGSIAFRHGIVYRQPALPVERVVDTTGCGDAFQAAFTACYFDTGDIRRSLKEGAIAGRTQRSTTAGHRQMPMSEGFVVFGDIHGCLAQLREILTQTRNFPDHQIVFLGDYIDRGPDSEGVIRLLGTLSATFLRGNHEQMLLDRLGADRGANARLPHQVGVSAESVQWIRSKTVFLLETDNYLFVHAGFDVQKPFRDQTEDDLIWTRYDGSYERLTHKLVVHGHTIVDSPDRVGNRLNINTGCGAGGPLTAVVLPEMRYLVSSASPGPEYNLSRMRKYLEGELEEL